MQGPIPDDMIKNTLIMMMINDLSMKDKVRDMQLSNALEVHRSVVNPKLTRSGFTVLMMAVMSAINSSASLSTILERVRGCLTFNLLLRIEISLWKLSPYWLNEVQVLAMCLMSSLWNLSLRSVSTGGGLKKSSFGFFDTPGLSSASAFLFCLAPSRSLFFSSSS